MASLIKKWKVDKLVTASNFDIFERYLNDLQKSGHKIYKIHFTKTDHNRYDQMIVVSTFEILGDSNG
jgi:hypothetical protein